jgi:hypothetical protein
MSHIIDHMKKIGTYIWTLHLLKGLTQRAPRAENCLTPNDATIFLLNLFLGNVSCPNNVSSKTVIILCTPPPVMLDMWLNERLQKALIWSIVTCQANVSEDAR